MSWGFFRPYVPVAQRRARAAAYAARLAKKEKRTLAPIRLERRVIAASFWGKAWCDNLESYSDFANRLPRGRTYVRNGSVIDLSIGRGKVRAIVSGSEIYEVAVDIKTLPAGVWSAIKKDCSRSIDSLIDLLQGRFDRGIMERLSRRDGGLFPPPKEITMRCSCPDWAGMCKHVAATLYGVGARLDTEPELLFTLRDVDHLELIGQAVAADNLDAALAGQPSALADANLGEIFGIDLEVPPENVGAQVPKRAPAAAAPRRTSKKAASKAPPKKKAAVGVARTMAKGSKPTAKAPRRRQAATRA